MVRNTILDKDLHKSTQIHLAPIVWEGELETSPEGTAGERGEGVAGFCIFNASKAQGTGSLNCSLFSDFCVGWRGMAGAVAAVASKCSKAKCESISDVWVCELGRVFVSYRALGENLSR